MSRMRYISFPKAFNAFLLSNIEGREKDYGISYSTNGYRHDMYLFPDVSPEESNVIIVDKKDATFNNCFLNKFVYGLYLDVPPDLNRKRAEIARCYVNDEVRHREQERLHDIINLSVVHSLCGFIRKHIKRDEFVEVYAVWTDHENCIYDSPMDEMTISLDNLLRQPKALCLKTWNKLTIVKDS